MRARKEISAQLLPAMLKGTPRQFWDNQIVVARQGKSTWDVDWQLALWANDQAPIPPVRNLITNIGVTGTHMKRYDPCINLPTLAMPFPLVHPDGLEISEKHDLRTEKLIRRSAVKNIELILKYALSLPFRRDETILGGTKKLFHSLATEMKSKNG